MERSGKNRVDDLRTLVARAATGDMAAYAAVVRRFQTAALGWATARLGDHHRAEDAVQEAFVQAYRDLPRLRSPGAFPAWFRRIVLKYCDRQTRRRQVPTVMLDSTLEPPSNALEPGAVADREELLSEVMALVHTLPEHQRLATTLYYVDGRSQKAIAAFMEVPLSTVKKRLRTARRTLKAGLAYLNEEELDP